MIKVSNSQNPEDFGWPARPTIVPYTYYSAKGFLPIPFPGGVAKGTSALWDMFLSELEPLVKGGFKPGTCWGYENRNIAGTNTRSFHSYGLAIDVNASYNGRGGKGGYGKFQMPPEVISLAKKYGMVSGLSWDWTDPMHFEIHLSPEQISQLVGGSDFLGYQSGPNASQSDNSSSWIMIGLVVVIALIGLIFVISQA